MGARRVTLGADVALAFGAGTASFALASVTLALAESVCAPVVLVRRSWAAPACSATR
jgi:hypothetical protein